LPPDAANQAQAAAGRIRQRTESQVQAILETGRDLISVKELIGHGQFGAWVSAEFGMSPRTAQNYMQAAAAFGTKYATVAYLPPATVYALAARSVPDETRQDIITRIETGERVSEESIKETLWDVQARRRQAQAEAKLSTAQRRRAAKNRAQHEAERVERQAENARLLAKREVAASEAAQMIASALGSRLPELLKLLDTAGFGAAVIERLEILARGA
jgi:hypothetical protein